MALKALLRKNLNFRTWIKRLARKTIRFSKREMMHDTVIGLLINKVEFKRDMHTKLQVCTHYPYRNRRAFIIVHKTS